MKGQSTPDGTYGFGLNTYDVWKRSFTQILNKGIVLEAWERKIYWVVQEQVFQYLVNRYHLTSLPNDASHATIFLTYDLQAAKDGSIHLVSRALKSSSVHALFEAFRTNPAIPSRSEFEAGLRVKLTAGMGLSVK